MLIVFLLTTWMTLKVQGHGSLVEPPGRSSLWRTDPSVPKNYDDNGVNCGGFAYMQSVGGKCGVCGDPWGGPRPNEAGGMYATGKITRVYTEGQVIQAVVNLTANHMGYFEFRICPNNDVTRAVTHDCLNQHVVQLADGSGTRLPIHESDGVGLFHINLQLPAGMTCTQCVLQWKSHNNNSPGYRIQEEFYACSDVAIVPLASMTTAASGTNQPLSTVPVSTTLVCKGINLWAGIPSLDRYCQSMCAQGSCPQNACACT